MGSLVSLFRARSTLASFTLVLGVVALVRPVRSQDAASTAPPAAEAVPSPQAPPPEQSLPRPPLAPQPAAPAPALAEPAPPPRPVAAAPCVPCEEDDANAEGAGAFLIGLGFFDFSSLNDRLAAAGYERIPSMLTVIGGEGYAVLASGFVIGGMGAAILSRGGNGPGDVETELGGGFGMVDLGFALVHTRALSFMLTGGIGGYGMSLSIHEMGGARFSDVLDQPGRGAELSRGGVLASATLRLEGKVPVGNVERGRQGYFTLGLRAGGLYGPAMGHWSLANGSDVTGDPDTPLAGFYVALTLGFGGRPEAL